MKYNKYHLNRYLIRLDEKQYIVEVAKIDGFYVIVEDIDSGEKHTGFDEFSEREAITQALIKFQAP